MKTVNYNAINCSVPSSIPYAPFRNRTSIEVVNIGDKVESIPSYIFYGCSGLTSITIGEGVTSIGKDAFSNTGYYNNTSNWENGVLYLDNCLIKANIDLADEYVIKGSTRVIAPDAFSDCTDLTNITIPESVTSIGNYAFSGCSGLTSITIPDNVTKIGDGAFYSCINLEEITLPFVGSSRTANGTYDAVFGYIFGYASSSSSNTTMQYYRSSSHGDYYIPSSLKKVTITDTMQIPYGAFYSCRGLTSITIPESVTSIGYCALFGCSNLEEITLPFVGSSRTASGTSYAVFGYIFGYHTSYLTRQYYTIDSYEDFSIPTSLKKVTITDATQIPYGAFYNCSNLTSIAIPDSVTRIGSSAFSGCSGLTSITIPDSVASIGSSAFYNTGYYNSTSNWEDGVLYIDNYLIEAKTDLKNDYILKDNTRIIADSAFYNCTCLTSITIPESVTSIGSSAFSGCSGLKTVNYNATNCSSPLSYTDAPFYSLTSIETVNIGDNVENIPSYLLYGCSGLTNITIPDNVTSIGSSVFSGCTQLNRVNITDMGKWCGIDFTDEAANPLSITHKLYLNDELVTNIVIPSGVTEVKKYAFESCEDVTAVTIPTSVTSIEDGAFKDCDSITTIFYDGTQQQWNNINIGNDNDTIKNARVVFGNTYSSENGHFGYSDGIITSYSGTDTMLVIPAKIGDMDITGIGSAAFKNCTNLTSVTISEGITDISASAFSGSSNLTSVTIPDSVTFIGKDAFKNTGLYNNSSNWKKGALYVDSCLLDAKITVEGDYDIQSGTRLIAEGALDDCSNLLILGIPASVQYIAEDEIKNAANLQVLTVDSGNPYFSAQDNVLFNKDKTQLITYPTGKTTEDYSIPDSVTSVKRNAFSGNKLIKSVTIPSSVKNIENNTFSGCTSLAAVTMQGAITEVKENAFRGCTSLDNIVFNHGIKAIDKNAFYGCSALKTLVLADGLESIGESAFGSCSSLRSVSIPGTATNIGNAAFSDCSSLDTLTFANGLTALNGNAFNNLGALKDVVIPATLTTIEADYFKGCNAVETVYIKDLSRWCDIDFGNANSNPLHCGAVLALNGVAVTSLNIPDNITTVKPYAFVNCSAIKRLKLPSNTATVGDNTFKGCSGIISVNMEKGITGIGENAFDGCGGIEMLCYDGTSSEFETIEISEGNTPLTAAQRHYESYAYPTSVGTMSISKDGVITSYIGNDTSIVIPNNVNGINVVEIDDYVFSGCSSITSLTIGSNIKTISNYSFTNCSGLKTLNFGERVSHIKSGAFKGCSNVETVFIGLDMQIIGVSAFEDCTKIKNVFYSSTESDWENIIIGTNNDNLLNANITYKSLDSYYTPNGVLYIKNGVITGYSGSDTDLVLPQSHNGTPITEIAAEAFYKTSLVRVTVPEGVTTIGKEAFYFCSNLKDVTLPDSVVNVGDNVFGYCTNLENVRLSKKLKIIPEYMFYGCKKLRDITIPDSVTTIRRFAFNNAGLKNIIVPNSVTTMEGGVFWGCSDLKNAAIGNGVTLIEVLTFYDCASLKNLILGNKVQSIRVGALAGCRNLDKVSVPVSLKEVLLAYGEVTFDYLDSMYLYYAGNQMQQENIYFADQSVDYKLKYGIWKYNSALYYLTYDLNGGEGNIPDLTFYEKGEKASVGGAPTKEGYIFKGWSDGSKTYNPTEQIPVSSNITLTAVWDVKPNKGLTFAEENNKWVFNISNTPKMDEIDDVYVAIYGGGKLISVVKTSLDSEGNANVKIDKHDEGSEVKVFFWANGMSPADEFMATNLR